MNLLNHIHDVIRRYPTLYKTDNCENSEILVLNHLFLVIGNGYEWYDGYLTDKYEEAKPYGQDNPDLLPADYFDHIETKLELVDPAMVEFFNELGVDRGFIKKNGKYYREVEQCARNPFTHAFGRLSPYPVSKRYSALITMPKEVRPDWLAGAMKIAKASLNYYHDEEVVKDHTYYPSEARIASTKRDFKKWWSEGREQLIKSFCLTEEVMADIEGHCWRNWYKYQKEQIEILEGFLEKHS